MTEAARTTRTTRPARVGGAAGTHRSARDQPVPSATVSTYDADLALAHQLADAAESLAMTRFLAVDLHVETKPDLTPVTDADTAIEQALRARLADERPRDGVLGEEFGSTGESDRRWVIDPIDGTKNFVRGVPVWSTLIALVDGEDVVVGVVAAPALGRRWWAARGAGSFVGGRLADRRQLRVSGVHRLEDASFSMSDDVGWEAAAPGGLAAMRARTWRTRGYGDFWSHVLVAEGAVDVAIEPDLGPWDVAALIPVVTEAGGTVTALDGGPAVGPGGAVSTNGALHPAVLDLLTR